MQYVGFVSTPQAREYTFRIKEGAEEPREFRISISNEAFVSRRARYQDAAEICAQRLQRELAGAANRPAESDYTITDAEIDAYRTAHTPAPKPNWQKHRTEE